MIWYFAFSALLTAGLLQLARFVASTRSSTLMQRITVQEVPVSGLQLLAGKLTLAMKPRNSRKMQSALFELPEVLDLLAIALASGESLYSSLHRVAGRANGVIGSELRRLLIAVNLGETLDGQLQELSKKLPQQQVVEFCNKLSLAIRRGTPLVSLLENQSQSARNEIQNIISRQAGKNETRMMIPLVFLILPITVLFAIFPSIQMLNLQTI